jgi:hypothetical protein
MHELRTWRTALRALNYRKGLWRLWLVIAVPWILYFAYVASGNAYSVHQEELGLGGELCLPGTNEWDLFEMVANGRPQCILYDYQNSTHRQIQSYKNYQEMALLWLPVPLYVLALALGLFYVGRWVTRGFKAT